MAKDFNVYQWRRQHLNEGHSNVSLKKAMEEWFGGSTPTKEEMINFVEWFYNQDSSEPNMIGINEEESLKVSTVTFDQVKGMKLPYDITGGAYIEILRPNVFDEWKDRFMRVYGDADLKANGDKLIARSEKVDTLQARAASDIRGAVGTVD
jgi:hypothetical protein